MTKSIKAWPDYDSAERIKLPGLPEIPRPRYEEARKWFTEEQFKKAEKALNAPDYPDLMRDLREAVYLCHAMDAVDAGEMIVLDAMHRLERSRYILSAHEKTTEYMGFVAREFFPLSELSSRENVRELANRLSDLCRDMMSFLNNDDSPVRCPRRGPKSPTWHFFFTRICAIYEKATGKRPTISRMNKKSRDGGKPYGHFLNFARESLLLINEHKGDETIDDVLGKYRKR